MSNHSAESVPSHDDWMKAVSFVRECYPEDVFPPDSTSIDCRSAKFARTLCDIISRRAWELHNDGSSGGSDGEDNWYEP